MVVVLPVPLTPQTSTTCGRNRARCGKGSATGSSSLATAAAKASRTSVSVTSLPKRSLATALTSSGRGLDAEVGRDQRLLQLLEGRGVQPPLGDDAGDLLGQAARGARQPGLEPREPALLGPSPLMPRRPDQPACRPRRPRPRARRSCRPARRAHAGEAHRRELVGVAGPAALDQRPAALAQLRAQKPVQRRLATRAQPGRALLAQRRRPPAASARPACRAGARTGKTCRKVSPASSTRSSVPPNIASSSVGKPAIRSAPKHEVGAQRRRRRGEPDDVGPPMPPLHALEHQVVAGLHGEVEMRHQPRLLGHQVAHSSASIAAGSSEDRRSRRSSGTSASRLASMAPSVGWPGRSRP